MRRETSVAQNGGVQPRKWSATFLFPERQWAEGLPHVDEPQLHEVRFAEEKRSAGNFFRGFYKIADGEASARKEFFHDARGFVSDGRRKRQARADKGLSPADFEEGLCADMGIFETAKPGVQLGRRQILFDDQSLLPARTRGELQLRYGRAAKRPYHHIPRHTAAETAGIEEEEESDSVTSPQSRGL